MSFTRLATAGIATRPLQWTGPTTDHPTRSPFSSDWDSTLSLLIREVDHLRGDDRDEMAVLEVDIPETKFRTTDLLPRADARTRSAAVALTVPTLDGASLRFQCDRFTSRRTDPWRENVRAIALALEALRKVDRYGVTTGGEQYAGWKQLPAPGESSAVDPIDVLIRWAYYGEEPDQARGDIDHDQLPALYRRALRATHPDSSSVRTGPGHEDAFHQVRAAGEALGIA